MTTAENFLLGLAVNLTYEFITKSASWLSEKAFSDVETEALNKIWRVAFTETLRLRCKGCAE